MSNNRQLLASAEAEVERLVEELVVARRSRNALRARLAAEGHHDSKESLEETEVMLGRARPLLAKVFRIEDPSASLAAVAHARKCAREAYVITLRYYEDKTIQQCGEMLGVSAGRARTIVREGLRKLYRHGWLPADVLKQLEEGSPQDRRLAAALRSMGR